MVATIEQNLGPEITALAVKVLRAYLECAPELRHGVREMIEIIASPESDEDERRMAAHTLWEILFPERPDAGVPLEEVDGLATDLQPDGAAALEEVEADERVFADRLRTIMQQRGATQEQLAAQVGVGQPAISMMLSRDCRPQRRTVEKLAQALDVDPRELWPDFRAESTTR